MAKNENEHVVIALFPDKEAAEKAIGDLRSWDKASDEIKLGATGTITREDGEVEVHVGRRTGRGAAVGAVAGIIAGVLSGGIGLVGGAIGGAALGGVTGAFFKKSLHLTEAEIEQIGRELDAGRTAVVVTCDSYEVQGTSERLQMAGGEIRRYAVPPEAIDEAVDAMAVAERPPAESVEVREQPPVEEVPMIDESGEEKGEA